MEMGHAHPMEISIRGFDASHLLPLSTNRFFRLNGKQPRCFFFSFLGQLLEHPVWRHLQLPVDYFCQFSGKFEKPCPLRGGPLKKTRGGETFPKKNSCKGKLFLKKYPARDCA